MNNYNENTQTFYPSEGGFTAEQKAEYDAFKATDAELKKYGSALRCGHPGSWVSFAQAGDGRSFNEIFGSVETAKTVSQNVNLFFHTNFGSIRKN